jgi:hypothetical protein
MPHKTDVSELNPAGDHWSSAAPGPQPGADVPATSAPPLQAAPLPREASPAQGTLVPPSSGPPSSDPQSSCGEDVAIFARSRDLPTELIALRTRRKK